MVTKKDNELENKSSKLWATSATSFEPRASGWDTSKNSICVIKKNKSKKLDFFYFFALMPKSSKKNQGWIFFLTLPHFKNTMQKKLTFDFASLFFGATAPIHWF